MNHKDKIATVFSLFNNASIVEVQGDLAYLKLKIACQNLAQMIQPNFLYFYITLNHIEYIALVPWATKKNNIVLQDINTIFQNILAIGEVLVMDESDIISIKCYINNREIEGGDLNIQCQDIQIADEENNSISLNDLAYLVKQYWQNI